MLNLVSNVAIEPFSIHFSIQKSEFRISEDHR